MTRSDARSLCDSWASCFIPPCILTPPLEASPSEYCHPVLCGKTRMVGLPGGVKTFRIVSPFRNNTGVCQTDGRTDILRRHSPRYAYASRGNEVIKFWIVMPPPGHRPEALCLDYQLITRLYNHQVADTDDSFNYNIAPHCQQYKNSSRLQSEAIRSGFSLTGQFQERTTRRSVRPSVCPLLQPAISGLVTERLRVRLTPGPLQATLSKLLTYCVLRPTQPPTLSWTGNE